MTDSESTARPAPRAASVLAINDQVTHLWMVRTFLKHADESEDDEELRGVVRDIYDFILAVGPLEESDDSQYLKMAKKKLSRLRKATELYEEIQPEVSGHTNFVMAARSLRLALNAITHALQSGQSGASGHPASPPPPSAERPATGP
ncbi:amidohydrolase [Roseiconus nitratireducens]|uniref:amidohydrolase n=1 Tax=Roseiconus nitratireducens TaxID=2605748 RepID=UPI001F16A43C